MSYVKCEICIEVVFLKCTALDLHMMKVHKETQIQQMDRKQKIAIKIEEEKKKTKEEIEEKKEDQKVKNKFSRREEDDLRGIKRELEDADDENETTNTEYTKVTDGAENEEDFNEEEAQGITFKGKSRKYIGAFNRLKEKITQGAEFKVKDSKLKILSTPKQKPMQVEVSDENGEKNRAQIQMYTPGKRGATVRITRASKEGFETVKIVADEFIETFLNIYLKGLIKGEEEMKKYIITRKEEKKAELFMCDKCEKRCASKQGLRVHLSWHIRNTNNTINVDKSSKNKKQVSFVQTIEQFSSCEWCYEKFTGNMKYQTINALLMHKKKCTNKPQQRISENIKRKCDMCEYSGKNERDMQNHMRDTHLNESSSTSPPPKRKKASSNDQNVEEMVIDSDILISKIEEMDITEKHETEEEKETKKRSLLMDQKVEQIKRKREVEEHKDIERKKILEKKRLDDEEFEKVKIKEALTKRKNEEKKIRIKETKNNDLKDRGISKLPEKYHHLVGEYNNVLAIPGNGSCQASAKAAILLQDQRRGPQLAIEENSYIVEHWEEYFINYFKFPHTLKLRGGVTKVCHTDYEFLDFLAMNKEVSFMWADHHQLAVTCNLYNTTVQVLTIDEKGEGSLLHEHITPDPVLAPYSLIPPTKPNGQKVDVPDLWLLYTNGNHYDALLKDDHPLITEGSMRERGIPEEPTTLKYTKKPASEPGNMNENKKSRLSKCDLCQFTFTSRASLEEHHFKTGHTDGVWETYAEKDVEVPDKVKSKLSFSEITKGVRMNNIEKEVLEFEQAESTQDVDMKAKLNKEIKEHKVTKKALQDLEVEHNKCKAELRNIQEKHERLNIQVNDMNSVNQLEKVLEKESDQVGRKESLMLCVMCEYPFKNIAALKTHTEKHKKKTIEVILIQSCGICGLEFTSNNEFRQHIKIKHSFQFNCDKCDFQGSSKMILIKHENLKHRTKDQHMAGTLKCTKCEEQFSSNWNLQNHIRDSHGKTKI